MKELTAEIRKVLHRAWAKDIPGAEAAIWDLVELNSELAKFRTEDIDRIMADLNALDVANGDIS